MLKQSKTHTGVLPSSFLHLPFRSNGSEQTAPLSTQTRPHAVAPTTPPAAIEDLPTRPTWPPLQQRTFQAPLEIGVGWHVGLERKGRPNEDSLLSVQSLCNYQGRLMPLGLLVVADGMGGHDFGQEASQLAMQHMSHIVLQNILLGTELSDEFFSDMLIGGVEWANLAVYRRGQELDKSMGTTMTAALIVGRRAYIVNVGDSRTYLFRPGRGLRQITQDHSVVAQLVAAGEIRPVDVYTHPERNIIYRCLGSDDEVEVDLFILDLAPQDRLLLCSDGVWEMVRDPQIERILHHTERTEQASELLLQAALNGGGHDNISILVAKVP
jgi:serine/threonine protein phosphatase PrpC